MHKKDMVVLNFRAMITSLALLIDKQDAGQWVETVKEVYYLVSNVMVTRVCL